MAVFHRDPIIAAHNLQARINQAVTLNGAYLKLMKPNICPPNQHFKTFGSKTRHLSIIFDKPLTQSYNIYVIYPIIYVYPLTIIRIA